MRVPIDATLSRHARNSNNNTVSTSTNRKRSNNSDGKSTMEKVRHERNVSRLDPLVCDSRCVCDVWRNEIIWGRNKECKRRRATVRLTVTVQE
jgi:hypothetical protein